jgi:hypothetical protein
MSERDPSRRRRRHERSAYRSVLDLVAARHADHGNALAHVVQRARRIGLFGRGAGRDRLSIRCQAVEQI